MLSGCYRILRARKVGRSTFAEIGAYEILRFLLKLYAVGSRSTVTAAIRLPPTSPREHFFFSFSYFHRGIDDDDHPELEPIVGTRGKYRSSRGEHRLSLWTKAWHTAVALATGQRREREKKEKHRLSPSGSRFTPIPENSPPLSLASFENVSER